MRGCVSDGSCASDSQSADSATGLSRIITLALVVVTLNAIACVLLGGWLLTKTKALTARAVVTPVARTRAGKVASPPPSKKSKGAQVLAAAGVKKKSKGPSCKKGTREVAAVYAAVPV